MINFQNVKLLVGLLLFQLFTSIQISAQSPYSLTNEWRFGAGAGLSFPTGDFPNSTAPISVGSNAGIENIEASTSISDQGGDIAIYTNTKNVFNVVNAQIRDLVGDGTCAASATGGAVIIPDPSSPNDTYYLFLANDITSGPCPGKGIHYYKFKKDSNGDVIYHSGPQPIVAGNYADESLTVGNDGKGNYWVVAHASSNNTFRVWKVDVNGVNALSDQLKNPTNLTINGTNSYSKISPCQDKIAWSGGGTLVVYEFDRTTGTIGNLLADQTGVGHGVGLEFSPNGQYIFYSGQANEVKWMNIATKTGGIIAGSASWSMQMGPDGKIYTSPGGANIGVINDPNNPSSTSYGSISLGSASTYWGLINLAWLSPEPPQINNTTNVCTIDLNYEFKNYFLTDIAVNTSTIHWDFGDGATSSLSTPSHTYDTDGTYTVKLTFNDATCGHAFTDSIEVTVSSCDNVVNPPACNYTLEALIDPISSVAIDKSTPVTVNFNGKNSDFDNSDTHAEEYYWILGSADISQAFSTAETSSLTFGYDGLGGNHPQGSYELYLVIKEGLCVDTAKISFNVYYMDVCTYSIKAKINPVNDIEIAEKNSTTVNLSADSSIFDPSGIYQEKYYWMIGTPDTMQAFSTEVNPSLTFAVNGKGGHLPQDNYEVYLVTREGLCLDTAQVNFNVTYFFIPNLVTPNGDRFNERFEITNTAGRFDVLIFNRWGDKVYDEKGYTNNWELSKVSDGIYFYQIRDAKSEKYYTGWLQVLR